MAHSLSKSRIAAFEQCSRKLWLMTQRPELAEENAGTRARFASGHVVGDVACRQRPGGVMVEADPDLSAALRQTKQLLADGHNGPIFEATFRFEGVLVRCDILERRVDGSWHMVEVKSSTTAKPEHLTDLATQLWVARGAGLRVGAASIRHLNPAFRLPESGDLSGLFVDSTQMEAIEPLVEERGAVVEAARMVLEGAEPSVVPSSHCSKPYDCSFRTHCLAGQPSAEWPVEILPHGGGRRLARMGYTDLRDVPAELISTPGHQRIHRATVTGTVEHDALGAQAAMANWVYPRIWLDFETVSEAVPQWAGCGPWRQVPFQFSAHIETAHGVIDHVEFLQTDGADPRRACAEALAGLPAQGSVIVWFEKFEKDRLAELAKDFPDLAMALASLRDRVVDLLPVARDHWYHRDQRGSWSLKRVLPTIAPQLDYASLDVKDGAQAQDAYREAVAPDTSPERREELEEGLRNYCLRDTKAMIIIAKSLSQDNFANLAH
ncbi:DUF2779 domain-containing protein [Novosphingobium sp. RD2P27]|uniref:DUF2779 domain-containing protein n=1 Tax=Novosphingobium kalidii TaxID=3230299 RepID=A0ABV2D0Y8_9SPHN